MANMAMTTTDKTWLPAARWECLVALQTDYSSADMIIKVVTIDLMLGNNDEANALFALFKRVDAKSDVIKLMEPNAAK